jgi:hypothetical protein
MKTRCLFSIVFFVSSLMAFSQFFTEDFETPDLYKVTLGGEGRDGKADYFARVTNDSINLSYSGATGVFFAGQDIDDDGWQGSASPSQLTWSGINIKSKEHIRFEGKFAEVLTGDGHIDKSDFMLLQYRVNDGEWQNLMFFANNGDTYNDKFYRDYNFDGIGEGTCISSPEGTMFTESQSFNVEGDTLALRFTVAVNSGDEDFAIDDFMLFEEVSTNIETEVIYDMHNPFVSNSMLVLPVENCIDIKLYSLQGKCVLTSHGPLNQIDISTLKRGMYVVRYFSKSGIHINKIMIP